MRILLIYFIIINIVAVITMYVDKQKAIKKQWRISEKTLFSLGIIGGSIGIYAGMFLYRHKTKHWTFRIFIPLIILVQAILLWNLFK